MALQNKLKAFVRFDGSGRVIPSSLILQKSKPKVGDWKEINATQCCNGSSSTTTTTTTNVTPTVWFGKFSSTGDKFDVCYGGGWSSANVYTSVSSGPFAPGTPLYTNQSLTTLWSINGVMSIDNVVYTIVNGYTVGAGEPCSGITTTTTTTTRFETFYTVDIYNDINSCTNGPDQTFINVRAYVPANGPFPQVGQFFKGIDGDTKVYRIFGSGISSTADITINPLVSYSTCADAFV
jgi:hypothetical protein